MNRALKKIEPILLEAEPASELTNGLSEHGILEVKRIETFISPLELDQPKEVLILFSILFIVAIGCLFSFFLY